MASVGRPTPLDWDHTNPWLCIIPLMSQEAEFWNENVHRPAAAWMASSQRGRPVAASEAAVLANFPGGPDLLEPTIDEGKSRKLHQNKAKRDAKKRRLADEREELKRLRSSTSSHPETKPTNGKSGGKGKSKDQNGKPLCFSWSLASGVCAKQPPGAECLGSIKRVHKCRICLSPSHQEPDCTSKT